MSQTHLSHFDRLTRTTIEFPALADLCFSLPSAEKHMGITDISWVEAANRLLDIRAAHSVWDNWLHRHLGDPVKAFRLAVSHMVFSDCDIVITSADELDELERRYDDAMEARRILAANSALPEGE